MIEVPGFRRRRLGGLAYLAVALPLGFLYGVRSQVLLALQLMSTATAASLIGTLLRRPFLIMATTSGTGSVSELSYLRSTRTWRLRRRLLGNAAIALAQTPESAAELHRHLAVADVQLLANPVELPARIPALDSQPRVLFAGRLSAEKGLDTLLDAWRSVLRANSTVRLTIAGEGGDHRSVEAELRARVERDPALERSVALPGWVPRIDEALGSHDVFVLPSRSEGMSNALLEACAAGRIVVASDIPGNLAVLGADYPLLFAPGDADQLADRLIEAIDPQSPLRVAARDMALERAQLNSTDAISRQLSDLLHDAHRPRH